MTVQDVEAAYDLLGDHYVDFKNADQLSLYKRVRGALYDMGTELAAEAQPKKASYKYYSGWPQYRCQYCNVLGGH